MAFVHSSGTRGRGMGPGARHLEVSRRQVDPSRLEQRLVAVRDLVDLAQDGERRLGRVPGFGHEPGLQQHLAAIGGEHAHQPAGITQHLVGAAGPVERGERAGDVAPATQREAGVVGCHRHEDGQVELPGQLLRAPEVADRGREVAPVRVQRAVVQEEPRE